MSHWTRLLSLPVFALVLVLGASGCDDGVAGDELGDDEASMDGLDEGKGDALWGNDSPCPTASESRRLSRLWWKTTRQFDRVAWTDDGKKLIGAELIFEEKISWNPLNGTTDKRKMCHQLFFLNLDGSGRQNVGVMSPMMVGDIFAYPGAGYALISKWHDDLMLDFERVDLKTGKGKTLATASGACMWSRVTPSPDGSLMAFTRSTQADCAGSGTETTTEVAFFDGAGNAVGKPSMVKHAWFSNVTWTPSGRFLVADDKVALAVAVDGTVTPTAMPGCMEPPTTSGHWDAQGRFVDVGEGQKPTILETDPARAFGCQE